MRHLVLTRGIPGCGKSTWIKQNNLEQYTLSADTIRLMYQSPIMNVDGSLGISQSNDNKVWATLFELMEFRMQRGEFIVVDATHSRQGLINRYKKLCQKYKYRCTVVDFTDMPIDLCLNRNKNRDGYKFVPESVIQKIHERLKTDKVSNWVNVIKPEEYEKTFHEGLIYNMDKYKKIVVFGDIHGCYEPIKEYFEINPFNPEYLYIFVGDLFDRGVQNHLIFEWIENIIDNSNVLLLEGNHEKHLYDYGSGQDIKSREFYKTIEQFEANGITKERCRKLYRKVAQFAYFEYGNNVYLVTHGGMPNIPSIYTPTSEMIKGVGKYEAIREVSSSWVKNTPDNHIMIHGHRNIYKDAADAICRCYNLCSNVEFGGNFRILEIDANNNHTVIKIKNSVYNESLEQKDRKITNNDFNAENDQLKQMLEEKDITKKDLGDNIVSFNFSKKVFSRRLWNDLNCKARGLFVNMENESIVARSYDKFFNWGERLETKSVNISNNTKPPYTIYKKENGFLGLLSYNPSTDDFFISSKSTNKGDYKQYFETILKNNNMLTGNLKQYLSENNVTFIFEVIDLVNDPHIIYYDAAEVVLLDIVYNEFEERFYDYDKLTSIAQSFNFRYKQIEHIF